MYTYTYTYTYIYIYTHIHTLIYVYIYIYREREIDRYIQKHTHTHTYVLMLVAAPAAPGMFQKQAPRRKLKQLATRTLDPAPSHIHTCIMCINYITYNYIHMIIYIYICIYQK